MGKLSIQHELGTTRPPRVQITYDVQVGNATVKKDLPFVVGVIGDFSGDPTQPLKRLKDRNFIEISRDNFDQVMGRMTPGLNLRVENTLEGDGSELSVQLKFSSMEDFKPARIVEQVEPLKRLMEARQKLTELKTKAELAPDLEEQLQRLLSDPDKLKQAGDEISAPTNGDPSKS
jgi:type VI secretion system protein ImpB